jgi:hypothetical protein
MLELFPSSDENNLHFLQRTGNAMFFRKCNRDKIYVRFETVQKFIIHLQEL